MEEGEAWTAPAGGWATVNLRSLAPVLSGLTYTATNSPAYRSSKQQESGLQSAEGRGGMGSGVVFKDHSSAFQGDNSSSLQPHLTEIQTRSGSKRCSCAQTTAGLACRPPRLSIRRLQTENSRLLCIICQDSSQDGDLDPLAGRYILFASGSV